MTPGTGLVNFRQVFANLKKGGFTHGPLVVECLNRAGQPGQITPEATKGLKFLNELVA
ncbi:MAG TPA: hypothetical protein VJA21_07415 [Verrucomicrobiae bacterium]